MSLLTIDDIILKSNNIDIEDILEKNHDLSENILYMLSFEKTVRDEVRDEQQKAIESILIDDNDQLNS